MKDMTEMDRQTVQRTLELTRPTVDQLCHAANLCQRAGHTGLAARMRAAVRSYRDDKVYVHLTEAYRIARLCGIITAADER